MHIKLKDAQWALPVEEHFGGFFSGFVVANMKDRAVLDKMMRESRPASDSRHQLQPWKIRDAREQAPEPGFAHHGGCLGD